MFYVLTLHTLIGCMTASWLLGIHFFMQLIVDAMPNKVLPTSPALVQNNQIAVISGKADYRLSFDITPTGTIGDYSSILHFTTDNNCCNFGQCSPAIWFHQGTTRLYVAIGDSTDGN